MTRFSIYCLLIFWTNAAFSLVNVERFRAGKFEEGFSGAVDGTVSLTKGNVDVLDVGARGRLQYQTRSGGVILDTLADELNQPEIFGDRIMALVDGRFAENTGVAFLNRLMAHLRWTHMYREWVGHEVYAQYQFNEFTRSEDRTLLGLGVRMELIRKGWGHIWFGTGYMAEYENLRLAAGDSTHQSHMLNHRSSSYLTAKFPIAGTAMTIHNTLYFQPRFDDLGDFRVLEVFELDIELTPVLTLLVTAEVEHDSRPPLGVRQTDSRLKNSLRIQF